MLEITPIEVCDVLFGKKILRNVELARIGDSELRAQRAGLLAIRTDLEKSLDI